MLQHFGNSGGDKEGDAAERNFDADTEQGWEDAETGCERFAKNWRLAKMKVCQVHGGFLGGC